jgi:hypothetical protein
MTASMIKKQAIIMMTGSFGHDKSIIGGGGV